MAPNGGGTNSMTKYVWTNVAAQIGARGQLGSTVVSIGTHGYVHPRGRNA